jgi:hypothetical protein
MRPLRQLSTHVILLALATTSGSGARRSRTVLARDLGR